MKEKIKSILQHMSQNSGGTSLQGYTENPDGSFELKTELSEFGHHTLLKYEATGDNEMLRIEIIHTFGYLNVQIPAETAAGQLLQMLADNTGSFSTTTAFIGVVSRNDRFEATLNSFHHFLSKWNDAEIAKSLLLHIFDLTMGLVTKDTSLTMLKIFGEHD